MGANITRKWAEARYMDLINQLDSKPNGTDVFNVTSYSLNDLKELRNVLLSIPPGDVAWQHTSSYHVACVRILKGKGQIYNRTLLNLYASGIQTIDDFRKAWDKTNHRKAKGVFPKTKVDLTSQIRKKQCSFIVANRAYPPNPYSKIPGDLHPSQVHRTHLISAQTTGIEQHEGLLIDYDGWLNVNPLNEFEQNILKLSRSQTIIWIALIRRTANDEALQWQYIMLNDHWEKIAIKTWADDRWKYNWYI